MSHEVGYGNTVEGDAVQCAISLDSPASHHNFARLYSDTTVQRCRDG